MFSYRATFGIPQHPGVVWYSALCAPVKIREIDMPFCMFVLL